MKRWHRFAFLAFLATFVLTGCIAPRATQRPRLFGDSYQIQLKAAPIVTTSMESTPTVVSMTTTLLEGYFFNDMGGCAFGAEFPPGWQYVASIYYEKPPEKLSALAEVTKYTDQRGQTIYEVWHPLTTLLLPPGYVSPKLRAPGGMIHEISVTHTRTENGAGYRKFTITLPLANVQGVDIYKGKRCRGDLCDWNWVQQVCYAR